MEIFLESLFIFNSIYNFSYCCFWAILSFFNKKSVNLVRNNVFIYSTNYIQNFKSMRVFIIGGTGLLGSDAARELIARGHSVTTLCLPPLPAGAALPESMEVEFGNFMEMSDEDLLKRLEGCDAFVFAAGIDERITGPAPIYDLFSRFNNVALERVLKLAKKAGVKHNVVCGSYFTYFDRTRPKDELAKWHPYIRSRVDQLNMAISHADENFDVAVLELPYIFGTQPGRKPVWVFLVEQIEKMKGKAMYPRGGTTMVTVKQVSQAIAGALEKNRGGNYYPIGYYNMTWHEMLAIFHKYMGTPDKKIVTIPKFLYKLAAKKSLKQHIKGNLDPGLHPVKFADLQCSNQFIDKSLGCEPLGVEPDDIEAAIGQSVTLSMQIIKGEAETIDMKGE